MSKPFDRRTATALLVAGTTFMEILDATVITTALPTMARDFGTAAAHLSLGVSAYLVALTVCIPIGGWAAERFGARRLFCGAIALFCLASLLCAASQNLLHFTLARLLQGLGGAMMVPIGRTVVLRQTPKADMVRTMAILTWPALMAPLLGPVLGGWLASHWSWHWIFLLNLPLGLVAGLAAWRLFPLGGRHDLPFDGKGFVYSALGFGLFMAGIEAASRPDISLVLTMSLLFAGIALLYKTVYHLQETPAPLFNLAPVAIPTFRLILVGGSLFRIAIATAPFLLPLLFQLGLGMSPLQSGGLLLWLFAGNLCMKPGTTWVMNRFGFRRVLVVNGLLVAAGFAAMAGFGPATPQWLMGLVLFVSGMNRSMHFTAINTLGYADVPRRQMRDATTLQAVFQQMNLGCGIALGALTLALACLLHGHDSAQAQVADFQLAFWLVAGLALLAVLDCLRLPADAGAALLRPRPQHA